MQIVTITAAMDDGSSVILYPVSQAVPAPVKIEEVDVVESDGTVEKFAPKE